MMTWPFLVSEKLYLVILASAIHCQATHLCKNLSKVLTGRLKDQLKNLEYKHHKYAITTKSSECKCKMNNKCISMIHT